MREKTIYAYGGNLNLERNAKLQINERLKNYFRPSFLNKISNFIGGVLMPRKRFKKKQYQSLIYYLFLRPNDNFIYKDRSTYYIRYLHVYSIALIPTHLARFKRANILQ